MNTQQDNPYWVELLVWLYTQQGNYDGAFQQLLALEKKQNDQGERLLRFSNNATADGQYQYAIKGYQHIMDKGKTATYYNLAWEGKLQTMLQQLKQERPINTQLLQRLLNEYHTFFSDYPQYSATYLKRNYAMVTALYAHQVDTAIHLLNEAIAAPNASKEFVGQAKLDLGDYYVLNGQVWDATLTYAQVDKAFKEDYLGEEARYRNARLSYYRGDFEWAQAQLAVLKASTTELIANDALYLSVLITENIPADSNMAPLNAYAAADLLLFQHKMKASEQLLDSIINTCPQTELMDDVLLLKSTIAIEEGDFTKAVSLLEKIIKDYGQDVLGDDATFKLAELYKNQLNNTEKALHYFEWLITEYPGSSYVPAARSAYEKIKKTTKTKDANSL
jgi:TolA-binding protein